MTNPIKSIGISLSILLAVGLLVLGGEAVKTSLDSKTKEIVQAQTSPAKYGYGQIVEIKLDPFYKTCKNVGVITAFNRGVYTINYVLCDTPGLITVRKSFEVKELDIIRVIEEENK